MNTRLLSLCLLSFVAAADPGHDAIESGLLPTWWIEGQKPRPASIEERMAYYQTPALSVAVVRDGRLAWARAWGEADLAAGRAADTGTLFQAASISKPIAALAVLALAEAGKLDLDGNVNDLLESWQVPDNAFTTADKVTPRRLLNHTAGLTVWGFPGYDPAAERPDAVGVLEGAGNTDPVRVFQRPGEAWQYSGGGYTVLQVLLEDVTGSDFATLMRKQVLAPLGMQDSTYAQPLPRPLEARRAVGYRSSGDPVAGGAHVYPEQAAAGLWTTPSDLAAYLVAVIEMARGEAGLLQPATVEAMLTPGMNDHGLGPGASRVDGERRFGHGGSNEGYRCHMQASVDGGWGVVVMTNSDAGAALGREVRHALAQAYGWSGFEPEVKTVIDIEQALLGRYAGTYELEGFGRITVEARESGLEVRVSWDDEISEYLPEAEHTFFDSEDRNSLVFELEAGEVVSLLAQGRFRAKRVE